MRTNVLSVDVGSGGTRRVARSQVASMSVTVGAGVVMVSQVPVRLPLRSTL